MTLPGGIGVAGIVLLAVLIVGVLAGRARQRFLLLVVGLVVVVIAGTVVATGTAAPSADRVQRYAQVLMAVVPLAVAYLAGWICGRSSWFLRIVVIAAAAILLAAFPYPAAAEALARVLPL